MSEEEEEKAITIDLYKLVTGIIHVVAGVLTSAAAFMNLPLAVMMFIAFIIYQLDEEYHLKDTAYVDIASYSAGMYIYFILKKLVFLAI